MKIAFPTDDGLLISEKFNPVKGFLVQTVQLGEIEQQEMRWINEPVSDPNGYRFFESITDCNALIVREIPDNYLNFLKEKGIVVNLTNEKIITKSILRFLEGSLTEKANHCCCP